MRTAAIAVAAIAAAVAVYAAGGVSVSVGPDAALGAGCTPVEHTRKHIHKRKVRRGGKLVTRRKKHIHKTTSCVPVASAPKPPCAVPSSRVQVISRDSAGSRYSLSRSCVTAGAVTVELFNQGEDPHNVFLRPAGSTTVNPNRGIPAAAPFELAPMGVEERTFFLDDGSWYLWCSLGTHEQDGMHATLEVR